MPPLSGCEYILDYLFTPGEVGVTMAGNMGAGPITHGELRAWMGNTGVRLTPFEARLMVRLSHEYLSESHRAEKLGCKPPWNPEGYKPEPTALQLSLRALVDQ